MVSDAIAERETRSEADGSAERVATDTEAERLLSEVTEAVIVRVLTGDSDDEPED